MRHYALVARSSDVAVEVLAVVSVGEQVEGAVRVMESGWPGIRIGLILMPVAFAVWGVENRWVAASAVLAGALGLWATWRWSTVALTDQSALVIGRGAPRRFAVDAIEVTPNRGGSYLTIGGSEYWVRGADRDEAVRLATLSQAHRP